MERQISVIIPNYNMAATIGRCLEAAFASDYGNFEIVVVDDHSTDGSVKIINEFPCKLIRLQNRSGTSKARNTGAKNSNGEILFFIDADCLLQKDTLSIVNRTLAAACHDVVVGGTYTTVPFDKSFFSFFQSIYVNYSETRITTDPDYIAAHAMIMSRKVFDRSGGFPENFLPIIEDVEFSHRLRRSGHRLIMQPDIQLQHIFNFSLWSSLRNAFRKTAYWCMYSLKNKDLLKDSGAASLELKTNVVSFGLIFFMLIMFTFYKIILFLYLLFAILSFNIFLSRGLFKAFYKANGSLFAIMASLYYTFIYPMPVGLGTITGMIRFIFSKDFG